MNIDDKIAAVLAADDFMASVAAIISSSNDIRTPRSSDSLLC